MRALLFAMALVALAAFAPAVAEGPRDFVHRYRGGAVGETAQAGLLWGDMVLPCRGVGGACFYAPPGTAAIAVRDDGGAIVAAWWGAYAGAPLGPLASGTLCGEAAGLALPEGTRVVAVALRGPAGGALACGAPTATPTTGEVALTFG